MALPAGAHTPAVRTPSEASGNCDDEVAIVVANDAAAQSDIYSAVTLAGVIDTTCIVLAGARNQSMNAAHRARLARATDGGYIVGGTSAVPSSKTSGYTLTRIAGDDRWETARLVGEEAVRYAAHGPLNGTPSPTNAKQATVGEQTLSQAVTGDDGKLYYQASFLVGQDLRQGFWQKEWRFACDTTNGRDGILVNSELVFASGRRFILLDGDSVILSNSVHAKDPCTIKHVGD